MELKYMRRVAAQTTGSKMDKDGLRTSRLSFEKNIYKL